MMNPKKAATEAPRIMEIKKGKCNFYVSKVAAYAPIPINVA
mgnify:CR=1 FL=1